MVGFDCWLIVCGCIVAYLSTDTITRSLLLLWFYSYLFWWVVNTFCLSVSYGFCLCGFVGFLLAVVWLAVDAWFVLVGGCGYGGFVRCFSAAGDVCSVYGLWYCLLIYYIFVYFHYYFDC